MQTLICVSVWILIVISALTVVFGQDFPWCTNPACNLRPGDPQCPGGVGFALEQSFCNFKGCPCGLTPPNITTCEGPAPGQASCPKDCGPAEEWIIAADGCLSCVCWRDNRVNAKLELEKDGTCPPNSRIFNETTGLSDFISNTPRRIFFNAPKCTKDLDCRGIKKCCDFDISFDKSCVDPEPECPSNVRYGGFSFRGKSCTTSADCEYGEACCGGNYSNNNKRCVEGVLPKFPPIRYTDRDGILRSTPSPPRWE